MPEIGQAEFKITGMSRGLRAGAVEQYIQQGDQHGKIDQPEDDAKKGINKVFGKIVM